LTFIGVDKLKADCKAAAAAVSGLIEDELGVAVVVEGE